MSAAVQRHNALISIIRLFLIYFILTSFPPFYRAMLCIRGILAMGLCLSVRPSQLGVLLKRLNESSWFLACEPPSTLPTLC